MYFKGYRALSCSNGREHKIRPVYHYTHEHEQYQCSGCYKRYTTLESVTKDNSDPESYIAKTLRFFRWRTTNE